MNLPARPDFWGRLAARTRPAGAIAIFEDHRTVARIGTATLGVAAVTASIGAAWFFSFGEPEAGWALVFLAIVDVVAWIIFAASGSVRAATLFSAVLGTGVITYVHVVLGGYRNSGAMLVTTLTLGLLVALVLGRRATVSFVVLAMGGAIVFAVREDVLRATRDAPDPTLSAHLFAIVLVANLLMAIPLVTYLLQRLAIERDRSERLLLNVLPGEVARELKEQGRAAARRFESVSVLFADIVGFTPLSESTDPEVLLEQLNEVFTFFDSLTEAHGCEKIRTIGDNYMVASGVPTPRPDHAQALAAIGFGMLDFARHTPFDFRIGINSGPVVAGVIGSSKFQYDIWGDTVNTASRMESHGESGKIQISSSTHELLSPFFSCTPRGALQVKGKGTLETWFLEGPRAGA